MKSWGNPLFVSCPECGKLFKTWPSRVKRGAKYCSNVCRGIGRAKNFAGENSPSWAGGKERLICIQCGDEFYRFPSDIKHRPNKFCSKKCANKWRSINERGADTNNWKGGITPVGFRIRASEKYKQWRQSVFIRDDFTCLKCGQRGGDIEAHHKKRFQKLLRDVAQCLPLFTIYDGAMIYTPLWDTKNGETLCAKCHHRLKRN